METIEAIRDAIADGATMEQKAAGARACRTIASALEAEIGIAPPPHPPAGVAVDQLEPLVARLSAVVAAARGAAAPVRARYVERAPPVAFVRPAARISKRRATQEPARETVATAPPVPTEVTAPVATTRVPPFVKVLAKILVRLALEEEGLLVPAEDPEPKERRRAKPRQRKLPGNVR